MAARLNPRRRDARANNGGDRTGTPGKPYPNRTDLTAQPITVATGQAYGQAKAQADAQRMVPLAGGVLPPSPPPGGGAPPSAPAGGPYPGEVTSLDAPTERPHEPLTHGLPMGPGAGPEVLPTFGAGANTLGDLVTRLAAGAGGNTDIGYLAAYLNSGRR